MNKMKHLYINNKGQVLLFVVVIMTVALSVGVSVSTRTLASLSRVTKEDTANKATAAAESGIEQLLVLSEPEIQTLINNGGTKEFEFLDSVNNLNTKANVTISQDGSNYADNGYTFNLDTRYTKEIKLEGYTGSSITVCWDNKNSALTYVLYDQTKIVSKDLVNPNGVTLSNTKGATNADSKSPYAGCITKTGINSNYYGIRIKILYEGSNVYVFPESGKTLPNQGYKFVSVGSLISEGKVITTKKVTATKSYSFVPGIFDDAIYTETTLND